MTVLDEDIAIILGKEGQNQMRAERTEHKGVWARDRTSTELAKSCG